MEDLPTLEAPESWAGAQAGTSAENLARGSSIDRYIVVDKLGEGGMGIVYSAYDPELDRRVAIKVMRPVGLDSKRARETRERTMREARGMAQLSHPNVVGIYDVGAVGDAVFLAMELIEGKSLRRWLEEEHDSESIIAMFIGAGRGLAAAHARGLVHRDFKPDNVMVGKNQRARVTDFGLVRDLAAEEQGSDIAEVPIEESLARLTQTGAFIGTPHYMAPEQLDHRVADERADQFSFCVALYEALFAEHPYPAGTLRERIEVFETAETPTLPRDKGVPDRVARALARGLSIDPAKRFATMEALLDELAPLAGAAGWRRSVPVALGVALVVGGGLAYQRVVAADDADSVCHGAEQRMQSVWNEVRADELAAAFDEVGGAFARVAAGRVASVFNDYSARWRAERVEACEATQKFREQTEEVMQLRMQCLDRRLGDLDALVSTLVTADRAVVQESVSAANGLETVESCGDVDALAAAVAPPTDPDVRAAVVALEPSFSRLRGLHLAGRYTQGATLAAEQLTLADDIGFRPAQARAYYWAGLFAAANARFDRAQELLEQAVWLAEAAGDDPLAADIWIERLMVLGQARGSLAEVPALERRASAALERLRAPPPLVIRLNNALGNIAHEDGRFNDAVRLFGEARIAAERGGDGGDRLGLATALSGIGSAEAELGKLEEARGHHALALAILEDVLGPLHPDVATTLTQLGAAEGAMGNATEAIAAFQRALAITKTALGDDHPRMATVQVGLAAELLGGGKAAESLPLFEQGLERMVEIHGENSKFVSQILNNRGIALRLLGRTLDSRADLLRAVKILEAIGDKASLANALSNVGDSFLTTDESASARAYFTRALAGALETNGPKSLKTAYASHGLGTALLELGQTREAIKRFRTALAIRVEGDASPKSIASAQESLAAALVRAGERREGCELWRAAEKGYESIGSERYAEVAREVAKERETAGCR